MTSSLRLPQAASNAVLRLSMLLYDFLPTLLLRID